jgi:mono/diheme cytochrome c family protein
MSASRRPAAAIFGALLLGCGANCAAHDAGAPASDAGAALAQGYAAVKSRQCGQCHQSPDPSDGVLSGQTTPVRDTRSYGANLTPDPDTGMDAWDADSIATAVLHGIDNRGAPLCPSMPIFADKGMGSDEALAVATYLQTLTPARHVVPASMCAAVASARDAGP